MDNTNTRIEKVLKEYKGICRAQQAVPFGILMLDKKEDYLFHYNNEFSIDEIIELLEPVLEDLKKRRDASRDS